MRKQSHPSALVAWVHSLVSSVAVLQQPQVQVAALMLASPGETCHAVTGISASISSYRCTFRPALVVSSPIGAFPTSASRPLCVPTAFGCLLTVARVPLTSFIFYPGVITSVHDVKDQFSSHLRGRCRNRTAAHPRLPWSHRYASAYAPLIHAGLPLFLLFLPCPSPQQLQVVIHAAPDILRNLM